MEDNRVGDKKLLVARSDKGCGYVDGCDLYQRMKNHMEVPVGKLRY